MENILERFVSLAGDADPSLDTYSKVLSECHRASPHIIMANLPKNVSLSGKIKETQDEEICRVLGEMSNNKSKTARALGISRSTLYRKLKKFDYSNQDA